MEEIEKRAMDYASWYLGKYGVDFETFCAIYYSHRAYLLNQEVGR